MAILTGGFYIYGGSLYASLGATLGATLDHPILSEEFQICHYSIFGFIFPQENERNHHCTSTLYFFRTRKNLNGDDVTILFLRSSLIVTKAKNKVKADFYGDDEIRSIILVLFVMKLDRTTS
jgi:hypothetical protein